MRALIHFMYRGGWSFQILAADCETLLIGYRRVRSKQILLRVVGKLGGSVELAEAQMAGSNRGSVWVDVSPSNFEILARRPVSVRGPMQPLIT
jgi:hypothetical protein